jgi:tetratricopeptide (TPR) repeat protein
VENNLQHYESAIRHFEDYRSRYPNSTRHAEVYFYAGESYYYLEDFLTAVGYYAQSAKLAYDSKLILMSKVSLGWSYIKLGKLKLARQYFDEAYQLAMQKNILSDDVLLGQASLYSEMKEYARALAAYTDLIKMFPDSRRIAEAYLGKGNICYLTEDYTGANDAYQKIVDLFSSVPERSGEVEKAYFGLAWAHLKLGDIDASIHNFKIIKDKTPNRIVKVSALTQIGDAYQDVGQFDKAINVYDEILKDYPQSPYTDYAQYRQGIALLRTGNIEAATLSFQSLQANFPSSRYVDDIRYYLAVAYFKKGDWATAREQISLFLKGSPKANEFMAEAEYILALSHFNLFDYTKALQAFQRILKDYPDQTAMVKDSEFWIAKCYHEMGQSKEAFKQFTDVIQKYPQSIIAQDSLMWLGDNALESGDFDSAIGYYQRLLDEFPGNAKLDLIHFELGQAYQAKGESERAINAFKEIGHTAPPELYARARLAIADIFARDVDPARAMETYQSIITGSPEFQRDAYFKIAEIYKRNAEYAQAARAYRNALNATGGVGDLSSAQLQFYIGDMHELLNERDKAVEEYLKIPYLYADEEAWVVKAYLRVARIFEDNEQWADARMTYQKVLKYDTDELKFVRERLEWIQEHVQGVN